MAADEPLSTAEGFVIWSPIDETLADLVEDRALKNLQQGGRSPHPLLLVPQGISQPVRLNIRGSELIYAHARAIHVRVKAKPV